MVRKATPFVFSALRLCQSQCRFTYELTVGHSIADLVILRAPAAGLWPAAPLSIVECAVLSSLRRLGEADLGSIADAVSMRADAVRRILLGRLSTWLLVREGKDVFRTRPSWVARSEIIAVEGKLTRWREALDQAATYRRYADRVFVLLPAKSAEVAAEHKDFFVSEGVGLLSYDAGGVCRMLPCKKVTEHTWHREFAISRLR